MELAHSLVGLPSELLTAVVRPLAPQDILRLQTVSTFHASVALIG